MSQPALAILRDSDAASAILSPVRRAVLGALRAPGSATTVGVQLDLPRQKVNYHLRSLEKLGLVAHVEDRRKGNCTERIVRATASHYLIAPSVLGELEAKPAETADRFSSSHLAAVSARTLSELAELRERADQAGKRLATLSLETAVRFASPKEQAAFVEELSNAVTQIVARYHDEADTGRWFRVTVGSHPALPGPQHRAISEAPTGSAAPAPQDPSRSTTK